MRECSYWRLEYREALKNARSFSALADVAMQVLRSQVKHRSGIVQVCGPISTGGFRSHDVNLMVMNHMVHALRDRDHHVFDQTPLEHAFSRLVFEWGGVRKNKGYCWPILHDVFLPIFESGLIETLYFLPGWERSIGASWERKQGKRLSIDILPYPPTLYDRVLVELDIAPF